MIVKSVHKNSTRTSEWKKFVYLACFHKYKISKILKDKECGGCFLGKYFPNMWETASLLSFSVYIIIIDKANVFFVCCNR